MEFDSNGAQCGDLSGRFSGMYWIWLETAPSLTPKALRSFGLPYMNLESPMLCVTLLGCISTILRYLLPNLELKAETDSFLCHWHSWLQTWQKYSSSMYKFFFQISLSSVTSSPHDNFGSRNRYEKCIENLRVSSNYGWWRKQLYLTKFSFHKVPVFIWGISHHPQAGSIRFCIYVHQSHDYSN